MIFLFLLLNLACQSAERTHFLQEQLWLDNRKWWYRDRELLEGKFQKMTEDPYNFMRYLASTLDGLQFAESAVLIFYRLE